MSTEKSMPTEREDDISQKRPAYASSDRLLAKFRRGWHTISAWFTESSTTLPGLPAYLQRWPVGYAMAIIAQSLATALVLLIFHLYPTFPFFSLLTLSATLSMYLVWGMAQGVFATLLRAWCLAFFVLPPRFSGQGQAEILGIGLYLLLSVAIGLLVSNTQRIRIAALAAQGETRATRQQFYDILLQSPTPITILRGPEHRVEIVHGSMQQIAGERELVGKPFREAFSAYEGQGFFELVEQVYSKGEVITVQEMRAEIVHYEGNQRIPVERFFNVSSYPLRSPAGEIESIAIFSLDITEQVQARKQMERLLQEREAEHDRLQMAIESEQVLRLMAESATRQLQTVFEAITDAVFILNNRTAPPQLNHAARALLEIPDDQPLDEQMGAPFELLDMQGKRLPTEQWPERRLGMGESLLSENAADVQMRTRSGNVYALSITGAPLRSAEGEVIGGVLVARNVTERRRLEQQTQESLRTLLMLAEALVSLPMNDDAQAAKNTSASPLETVGERLAKLISAVLDCQRVSITTVDSQTGELRSVAVVGLSTDLEQRWRERDHRPGFHLRDLLEGTPIIEQLGAGEVVVVDMRQPPFDKQPNPYGITTMLMAPMRIGTRLIGMLVLDDNGSVRLFSEGEKALTKAVAELAALIMERERLQEERVVSHASILALQEANHLKDEFIGIAGHELRTPLTTIKASVQLAKRQLARMQGTMIPLPSEVATTITALQNLLDRAERQVGMQNRLVSDLLDVSRIEVGQLELHPALNDLQRLVQETVEDQRALTPERQINLQLAPVDELLILGDADRLRQVLINYLTNALKYSESTKPIFVRVIALEHEARVEVEDRGPGLSEGQQQRIWERFYRVPEIEVKSGSGVGLGLGLHISRTIIERHDGRVGIQSTPGQGSTFWLTVPKAEE